MVKICEVVDGCEECPKYGDDCDGDKMTEPTDYINRADAINVIRDECWECNNMFNDDLYMKILALPSADAEPTETSTLGEKHQLSHGRLIDADELKKHLDGAWEELNDDGERKGVRLARWYLISAPTVSADAVQGEWQKVEEQPYFRKHYDTVCCSVCRKKGNRKWNFCPNCGAKMKGGDTE